MSVFIMKESIILSEYLKTLSPYQHSEKLEKNYWSLNDPSREILLSSLEKNFSHDKVFLECFQITQDQPSIHISGF